MEARGFVIQCEINLERKVRIDWGRLENRSIAKKIRGGEVNQPSLLTCGVQSL